MKWIISNCKLNVLWLKKRQHGLFLKLLKKNSILSFLASRYDVFTYSYCYIGILTGPYFEYRTYKDWIEMKYGNKVCFYVSLNFWLFFIPISFKIDIKSIIIKRGRTLPFIIIGFFVLSKMFQETFYGKVLISLWIINNAV